MPQTPCPYCGHPHAASEVGRCDNCNGLFELLSSIATQLAMGPWYVRDKERPFMPGFNEEILRQQVAAGRINANTIMRGPTTHQFWMSAGKVPGVSRLMGTCHACNAAVSPKDTACKSCQADLSLPDDVDRLGLKYTTAEQRDQAKQEMAKRRASKPKPSSKPTKPTQGSTVVNPDLLQPVEQAPAQAPKADPSDEQDDSLVDELAEDVWHAGPASPSRRRKKRRKGPDPLVLGMGVMFLCVVALGLVILLTGGGNQSEDDSTPQAADADKAPVQRNLVDVSRASVPALAVYERLEPESVPEPFEERYKEVRRLIDQAQSDQQAERYNEAYAAYQRARELVAPLESDIAAWQAEQRAKAEATELRDRVALLREQAQEADAPRWSAKEWQTGQAAWDEAQPLYAAGQYTEAGELLTQAESTYLTAENKALAGQAAGMARAALFDAMKASISQQTLSKFAGDQLEAMERYRVEADQQLNDQRYAQAEQTYNNALDALREAEQVVELTRYKKFYAFDAGLRASGLMLSAARGDGIDASAQNELAKRFENLRILPNPAEGITPGDDVGFTIAIEPLINDARDAILKMHGQAVQACYLAGFHASIIDETLKTNALSDDQQKRIHQSLGTIEKAAQDAGWDINKLRPVIDQVRIANRNADLKSEPTATRLAWKRLIGPIQSRESAAHLMEPTTSPADDPELFPDQGS